MRLVLCLSALIIALSLRFSYAELTTSEEIEEKVSDNVLQLANEIAKIENRLNDDFVVFSPLSIFGAMNLLLLGANGNTRAELIRLLKYEQEANNDDFLIKSNEVLGSMLDEIKEDIYHAHRNRTRFWSQFSNHLRRPHIQRGNLTEQRIEVANGIFVQNGFSLRREYQDVVENVYNSTLHRLDFKNSGAQTMQYLNNWVKDKTAGKVPMLVNAPLPPDTTMVIASAIYFKAQWESTFPEELTRQAPFYPNGYDKQSHIVDMMPLATTTPYYESLEHDCRILALPYKQHLTTMFIILPNLSSRERLREFQSNMTAEKINSLISKMTPSRVVLTIPKMHLVSSLELKRTLETLGCRDLFIRGRCDLSVLSATANSMPTRNPPNLVDSLVFPSNDYDSWRVRRDFDSTSNNSLKRLNDLFNLHKNSLPNPGLYAEDVIHKIDLTINEHGTEGAAVTYITATKSADALFRVDTPFMFVIRHDETRLPLFYGSVFLPKNS